MELPLFDKPTKRVKPSTTDLAFLTQYDNENPDIWSLFHKFANQLVDAGITRYSARTIIEKIRWEIDVPSGKKEDGFKINSNMVPYYARKFMSMYPMYEGLFETRKSKLDVNDE